MKLIARRLRNLETALNTAGDRRSSQMAAIVRERRRRRLEASGQPFVATDPPAIAGTGRRISVAETLRLRRRLRAEAGVKP